MADDINLVVIAPELPPGSCIDPEIIDLIGKTQVLFPSNYSLFISGSNEPTVEQRDYAWIKTNSTTDVIIGIFKWSALYGKWLKHHFINGSVPTSERRLYVGTEASLETYDGGEPGTVTATTGPFWEKDKDTTSGPQTDYPGSFWIKATGRIYDRSS